MTLNIIILCLVSLLFCFVSSAETINSKCEFPGHNYLHKGIKWITTIEGQIFEANDDNNTYHYSVGICITPTISGTGDGFKFASVIQKNLIDTVKPLVVIGRYNSTDIKLGTNWGFLEFGNGEKYSSHCGQTNRVAMLMITCNPAIEKGVLRVIEENNQKDSNCYYLFELEHPQMCPPTVPTTSESLGKGSIAVIIIVFLIAAYLCLGMAIKKVFYNAQGIEVIPNITIWRCFGETFSNCVEKVCRPRPFSLDYEAYRPAQSGNLTINDLEPDDLDDDETMVLP